MDKGSTEYLGVWDIHCINDLIRLTKMANKQLHIQIRIWNNRFPWSLVGRIYQSQLIDLVLGLSHETRNCKAIGDSKCLAIIS